MADDGHSSSDDAAVEQALSVVFPNGLPVPANPRNNTATSPIVRSFPLTIEHMQRLAAHYDSGETLGVGNNLQTYGLQRIKRRHHRLAMILAAGELSEAKAALACGLHPNTVTILKQDPMFQELLDVYSEGVTAAFRDTVTEMAELADDVVELLRAKLDEQGDHMGVDDLRKLLTALTDRSGNGPTSNTNIRSVALNLSSRDLADAKADAARRTERPLRQISAEGRRALDSLHPAGGQPVRAEDGAEGKPAGTGPALRAQGDRLADSALFRDEPDAGEPSP